MCDGACRTRRISLATSQLDAIAWDFLGSEFAEQIHADWPVDRRVLGATPAGLSFDGMVHHRCDRMHRREARLVQESQSV